MQTDHFSEFLPAACAGFGLFLVGAVNLLLGRRSLPIRGAATLAAVALALGAPAALDQQGLVDDTARLLAFGLVPCLLLSRRVVTDRFAVAVGSFHRPPVRFGLLATVGVGLLLGSILVFEHAQEADTDAVMAELEATHGRAPCVPNERVMVATDRGTRIVVKEPVVTREAIELRLPEAKILKKSRLDEDLIRRGPADERTNCHGWVFTGGRFLLAPEDVAMILAENGYRETDGPRPGDLIVYSERGAIAHTAVVRYVAAGQPVLVEGKWGYLGVFLHPANKSVYGTEYAFYRSTRRGHMLAGFDEPARGKAD